MKKIVDSIKYLKFSDFIAPFIFILMLLPSFILRLINKITKKRVWLICEDGVSARDNGYFFFNYLMNSNIDENVYIYYVIDKKSKDYNKVKKYNNIIQFKGIKHWILYLSAEYNISNHKHGNPNQILFYLIHVNLNMFNNRVFLQHGITKDLCDWLLYKNTKFKYFICGAKKEYDYIKKEYGYPEKNVQYTGFARFDSLHDFKIKKNTILVMPTWRNWLGRDTNSLKSINFEETSYFKVWNEFLNNKELINFIEENNVKLIFYPHINMQKYINSFSFISPNIIKADLTVDIQEMLKSSELLVTDYSSVYMDFAYMNKPIIYFQFDYEEYRKKQYQEGYFNYKNDGFGDICLETNDCIKKIKKLYDKQFSVEEKYKNRMNNFFEKRDKLNCKRIYDLLLTGDKNEM